VNPVGPRGVYDEAKRLGEAMTMAYHRAHGLETRIARIFNTIGSRMRLDDGRAVPTFITQAVHGQSLTVHGDGSQTRSGLRVRSRRRRRSTFTEQGYRAGQPWQPGGDPRHRSREDDHPHRLLRFRSDVRGASGGRFLGPTPRHHTRDNAAGVGTAGWPGRGVRTNDRLVPDYRVMPEGGVADLVVIGIPGTTR
jgi:NAD dependent epimerase/dehydratase family